jgi:hypothetical protein
VTFDAESSAIYDSDGWWDSANLGRFSGRYYPALWIEQGQNWFIHSRQTADTLDILWDPIEGWIQMLAFPYAWHFASGEFVRYVIDNDEGHVLRYQSGKWQ